MNNNEIKEFLIKTNNIDKDFYYPDNILNYKDENNHKCDISLIHSGRNRGKSYGVTMYSLAYCWNNQKELIFFRRYDKELKKQNVLSYFSDKTDLIKSITNNECDSICIYESCLYFSKFKIVKGKTTFIPIQKLGYYYSLNLVNQLKSMQFPNVDICIIEEIFTTDTYTPNEPTNVLQLFSTVARNRDNLRIFMLSNNVSRVNPYTSEWGLTNLARQKPGTIESYKLYTGDFKNNEEQYLNICIEYLSDRKELKQSEITRKNVFTNKWEIHGTHRIIKDNDENIEFLNKTMIFEYNDFKFKCDFILYEKEILCYITRKTTLIRPNTRLITNRFYEKEMTKYVSKHLAKSYCKLDKNFLELYNLGRIAFCDVLTAEEFEQILPHLI